MASPALSLTLGLTTLACAALLAFHVSKQQPSEPSAAAQQTLEMAPVTQTTPATQAIPSLHPTQVQAPAPNPPSPSVSAQRGVDAAEPLFDTPTIDQLKQRLDFWLRDARLQVLNSLPTITLPSIDIPSVGMDSSLAQQGKNIHNNATVACLKDLVRCYEQHKPDLLAKCEKNGNPLACVQLSTLAQETGHMADAINPLRQACGAPGSPTFAAPGSPEYFTAMACTTLGNMAQQAGQMDVANQYFNLGCSKGNPLACTMGNSGF